MNELYNSNIDLAGLKQLYDKDEVARSFLDNAAGRLRNLGQQKVDRTMAVLLGEGVEVSRGDIVTLFKEFEELGLGRFIAGRKGHSSRFEWEVGLVSVGKAAAGESEEIETISETEREEEEEFDQNLIKHRFQLRPELNIEIQLPSDFTASEAERLGGFIKTLPFN